MNYSTCNVADETQLNGLKGHMNNHERSCYICIKVCKSITSWQLLLLELRYYICKDTLVFVSIFRIFVGKIRLVTPNIMYVMQG